MLRLWLVSVAAATLFGAGGEVRRERPKPFLFEHDVLPLFERLGCSSAYCHGSATGRGTFKLSLFGSDPVADHREISEEFGGRRLDFLAPEKSLLLLKPTQRLQHGGGRRLDRRSPAYARLVRWIEDGAPFERGPRPFIEGLRIERRDGSLRVLASFAVGGAHQERDVTALAKFTSSNEQIVAVQRDGSFDVKQAGEGWLFARYAGRTARLAVRRPFADRAGGARPGRTPIDRVWYSRLAALGLEPAPRADPHTLLRRVYLDLAGRGPKPSEIRRFFQQPAEQRLATTVRALLEGHAFPRRWAGAVARWLEIPEPGKAPRHRRALFLEVRASLQRLLEKRLPLTEIARQVLAPRGELRGLVTRHRDPRDRAEFVGRSLLGVRIGCARCHDHPLDVWRRTDHLAFAAFFADARPDPVRGGMKPGTLFHPVTRRPVEPRLLPVGRRPPAAMDREQRVLWFVLDSDHGLFARAFANRVFATLFGRGLVEPLDDQRMSNPAIHEELLECLAQELSEAGYDLREFLRKLMTTDLYAVTSAPPEASRHGRELRWLARRDVTRLEPAVLRHAAAVALGVPSRPTMLPDSPLALQLALRNGRLLSDLLETEGNQVDAIFAFGGAPRDELEDLYDLLLARPPTARERETLLPRLRAARDRPAFGRDLAFALLASREFGSKR